MVFEFFFLCGFVSIQNAELLFKHSGGQYSALDMAQYVFWTGDEEGVAKAVEEFIRKGLVCSLVRFYRFLTFHKIA